MKKIKQIIVIKFLFIFLIVFFIKIVNGQHYLSLGGRNWGLGFSNHHKYNGIRLNLTGYPLYSSNIISILLSLT
ncbi:MAG: hypothetical protein WCK02_17310, partial [Bacteroidota bacterium]